MDVNFWILLFGVAVGVAISFIVSRWKADRRK